jgi:hypothetical protein
VLFCDRLRVDVRYVTEGSIQGGGNCMRVNVQLIDAGTRNHLWAERIDKPLADPFDMQDEIAIRGGPGGEMRLRAIRSKLRCAPWIWSTQMSIGFPSVNCGDALAAARRPALGFPPTAP